MLGARLRLICSFLGLIICGHLSAQEEWTLRVHHFLSPTSVTHARLLVPWARAVERASNNRIRVVIYPTMQLGGAPPQLYDQAVRGLVDVVWTLPGYTAGRFPKMEVFELPFMAGSAEATSQAAYEFYTRYARDEFDATHVLTVHVHRPGQLHMKNKPIRRLEDLRGTKIRAPGRVSNLLLKELGATPVAMPVPSLPDAIAKGVVDGALIPYEVALPLRLHELTNSHTDVRGTRGLYTAVFLLTMNKKTYAQLPTDLQRVIDQSAGLALARRAGRLWDEADPPVIAAAKDLGDRFYLIEGEELERWQARGQRVTQQWIAEMKAKGLPADTLVKEARRLITKYE